MGEHKGEISTVRLHLRGEKPPFYSKSSGLTESCYVTSLPCMLLIGVIVDIKHFQNAIEWNILVISIRFERRYIM